MDCGMVGRIEGLVQLAKADTFFLSFITSTKSSVLDVNVAMQDSAGGSKGGPNRRLPTPSGFTEVRI